MKTITGLLKQMKIMIMVGCGMVFPFKSQVVQKFKSGEKDEMTPGIQKVFDNSSLYTMKSMTDWDEIVFRDMLHDSVYHKDPKKTIGSCEKNKKDDFNDEKFRFSDLDTKEAKSQSGKLKFKGIEKKALNHQTFLIFTVDEKSYWD